MTTIGGEVRGGGTGQIGKSTHGHGQQCGDCWGEEGIRRLNGNGKNTIKIKSEKKINLKIKNLLKRKETLVIYKIK